jgi:hypothetical protein
MPWKVRRPRIKLAKGLSLNFGKRGTSVSIGSGRTRTTIGPQGTRRTIRGPFGLSYVTTDRASKTSGKGCLHLGCLGCALTLPLSLLLLPLSVLCARLRALRVEIPSP